MFLAAVATTQRLAGDHRWQFIAIPDLTFDQDIRLGYASFFLQFPHNGLRWRLAMIDAALWHLPAVFRADPSTHPHQALAIGERNAHAGAVGEVGFVGH